MTTITATLGNDRTGSNDAAGAFARLLAAYKARRARRRTQIALGELEDHVLRDIGFDPSGVRRADRDLVDWVVQTQSGTARLVFIGH